MIKMDIFLHKNPQAHLLYIFIYSLVVSFFQKRRAHGDLILEGFFCIVGS